MSTVAVAQLVESRIVIPVVVGSSPISHPKNKKRLAYCRAFFMVVAPLKHKICLIFKQIVSGVPLGFATIVTVEKLWCTIFGQ